MRTFALLILLASVSSAMAEDRIVGSGEAYTTIDDALRDAVDGDVVIVRAGTYDEALTTRADGVTLRGEGEVIVTTAGRVLDVQHDRFQVDNVIFDAQMADTRGVRVEGNGFRLIRSTVRNVRGHCVDLRTVDDVVIDESLIHGCMDADVDGCSDPSCQADAHGIVGGAVQGLLIRNTEIHTFSGDALQLDSDWRDAPRPWTDVRVEGCTFWVAPLEAPMGGVAAGIVAAENAIDTKTQPSFADVSRMELVDTIAYGFRSDLISNAAAFNLKQDVVFVVERVSVYDSEIAFRLRGAGGDHERGARVSIENTVIWDVDTAIRHEDDIAPITLRHVTFGRDIGRLLQDASSSGTFDVGNVLVLGTADAELVGAFEVGMEVFEGPDDYRLVEGASVIDMGADLGVAVDRLGIARPQGAAPDPGAYEFCEDCEPVDAGIADGGGVDAGPGVDGGPGSDAGRDPGTDASIDAGEGTGGGGCGCGASGAPVSGALILLVLAIRRR